MKEYIVKAENAKHYTLIIGDKEIGQLEYKKWFSIKAEIILHTIQYFEIEPTGFWKTAIVLKQQENVLLTYKMNFKGNISIQTKFDEIDKNFVFKQKGFFKSTYVLLDETKTEMLSVEQKFKWGNFNYDYTISTTDDFDTFKYAEVLLLTIIHIINYYRSMVTAAAAG